MPKASDTTNNTNTTKPLEPQITALIELAKGCQRKTGKSLSTIARLSGQGNDFFKNLESGKTGCQIKTFNSVHRKIDELNQEG